MQTRMIKIAMGQMLVEGGRPDNNLARALCMIRKAAEREHDIIVLPECIDIGWTYPDAPVLAREIPGERSAFLCKAARENSIFIAAGLTERADEKIFNSAVFISPRGDILLKHRKINILDIAQDIYNVGTSLSVVETEVGNIGLDICADNFPDSYALGHTLARMGCDIILSPSSWAIPPDYRSSENPCQMWEDSYTRLAYLFEIPIIGVSNTGIISAGVWKNYHCIGNSLAVSKEGIIIAQGERTYEKESLISVDVEISSEKKRGTDISPMLKKKGFLFDPPLPIIPAS